MKEKPIIMNSEGVRGILENRKSQTRRILKPQPKYNPPKIQEVWNPPYQKGQVLWVRETHYQRRGKREDVLYLDDSLAQNEEYIYEYDKVPSIHMPRWASRITLEVTDVAVEKIRDISEEDAKAEGCLSYKERFGLSGGGSIVATYKWAFMELWNEIYDKDAWNRNDFVWKISFKKIDNNKGGN